MRLELSLEALIETDEAAHWYDSRRLGLGGELLAELDAALRRVAAEPTSFPPVQGLPGDLDVRRCLLSRFPYGVVFTVLEDHVRVVAVAHLKRRPGYWLNRTR